MRTRLLILTFFGIVLNYSTLYAQEKINFDDLQVQDVFIFSKKQPNIRKCKRDGTLLAPVQSYPAPINATFNIIDKSGANDYIIQINFWKTKNIIKNPLTNNIAKALLYNYNDISAPAVLALRNASIPVEKLNTSTGTKYSTKDRTSKTDEIFVEDAYFLISKNDLLLSAVTYNPESKINFVFGTVAYLIKVRPRVSGGIDSRWESFSSVGITYGPQFKLNKNWGISTLGGLAFSKINLDKESVRSTDVNYVVPEKIAVTPSFNLLFNYKQFSFGGALGMDWINQNKDETNKWIYNKKLFWTVGLGFNLFTSGETNTTEVADNK